MKEQSLNKLLIYLRICIVAFVLLLISAFLFSFSVNYVNDDFLKQLGMGKADADKKITGSILGGYLDTYGVKNAKNIALGNRAAVVKDLLIYTKNYVAGEAFKKEYAAMKENYKPKDLPKIETPEEMRNSMIKNAKDAVQQSEEIVKKAATEYKKIFEENLEYAKKNLKDAEDPKNKYQLAYRQNYAELVKNTERSNQQRLQEWEAMYPADHLLFIKLRLQQFLEETKDIDFAAETTLANDKKIFVNRAYESKGNRWKMAYRAGKEMVGPARAFVQQWLEEIK